MTEAQPTTMVTTMTTAMPTEGEGERLSLSSPSQSDLEKPSPAPGSIHSTTPKPEEEGNKESTDVTADPDAIVYPSILTKVLVGVGLALAVFLVSPTSCPANSRKVSIDQTIVATAIPTISDHFKALNDVGWYASAFFLTTYVNLKFQLLIA